MVLGSEREEEHRRSRCKYTSRGKCPQEKGKQGREMQNSVHGMENGEERGRQAPSRSHER